MPFHVLHTLSTAQSGYRSFSRIVAPLARGLDPERYQVHAWFLGETGPVVEELRAAGAQVRVIGWPGGRRDPAGALRFWKALRSQDWDIIHVHAGGGSLRCLAHAGSRAKVIQHVHARNTSDQIANGFRATARMLWDADIVIATSRAVADTILGRRPYVIYPGVVISDGRARTAIAARASGKLSIGVASRLVAIKGLVYLIRAMALLIPRIPEVRLEIAGSGPAQAQLESEVQSLGLQDCVTFLGWQTDVEACLARWDVFAMPSLEEGFGIAALEAMAFGLPVVATAVGGIPELVQHGRTGWLVPPRDVTALADRIGALLLDTEQRRAMGAAGQERARRFSIDRMVSSVAGIYDGIVNLRPKARM
jgi:glycosyltransferase involved in cell wall biosynthesis